jgi:hypothetical protein
MKGVDILFRTMLIMLSKRRKQRRISSTEQSRLHQVEDHVALNIDDNLDSVDDIGPKTRDT